MRRASRRKSPWSSTIRTVRAIPQWWRPRAAANVRLTEQSCGPRFGACALIARPMAPDDTVCLLDALPEAAALIAEADLERARSELTAPLIVRSEGPWPTPPLAAFDRLAIGVLVVDGLLLRDVRLGETTTTELVGRGDVLGPPDHDREPVFPAGIEFTVLKDARLAVLDVEVTAAVCRWQPVVTAIVTAAVRRSFGLAELLAVSHLRRVDERLLVLF